MSKLDDTRQYRYKATRKVTIIGAVVNILLALAQFTGGFLAHSQALIADATHTLSDLFSDFIVLLAAKESHREADSTHPYGHGRIETLATTVLGMILLGVAAGIVLDVVPRLLNPEKLFHPTPLALAFAALAVIAKEGLYQYTVRVAKKVNSSLLKANAWHHRSDAISSFIVIIGIAGSLMGVASMDAIAALIVTIFIARIGWKLLWQSGQELIDASLSPAVLKKIQDVILSVDGVKNLHCLRTRRSGADAFADVHIQVPSKISVSEGHQLAEAVRKALISKVEALTDVTVHIDPEDDAESKPCAHLPLREEVLKSLQTTWRDEQVLSEAINAVHLHYLNGSIDVDIVLPRVFANGHEEAITELKNQAASVADIRHVTVYFSE